MNTYHLYTMTRNKQSIQTLIMIHKLSFMHNMKIFNSFARYKFIKQRHANIQTTLRESSIFSSLRKAQNLDSSRGFVNISASCFSVLTWRISISRLVSWSLKKWWWMSMCLVLEWLTGLFASLIALSLSHNNGILVKWHPKSWRVCLIKVVGHNMHRP